MTRYVAIGEIRAALSNAPQSCRYHGTDFGFVGTENGQPWGEPRCESCKQPWRVTRALAALDQLDARVIELQAQSRELGRLRGAVSALIDSLPGMVLRAVGVWTLFDAVDGQLRTALDLAKPAPVSEAVSGG